MEVFFSYFFLCLFFFLLENSLHMQKEQRQWMAGPSHKISLEIRGNQSIARTQIGDLHSNCVNIDRAFIFFADLSKMFMYRIPNKNGKKGILYCFLFLKKSKLSQRIMRHAPIFKLVFFFNNRWRDAHLISFVDILESKNGLRRWPHLIGPSKAVVMAVGAVFKLFMISHKIGYMAARRWTAISRNEINRQI